MRTLGAIVHIAMSHKSNALTDSTVDGYTAPGRASFGIRHACTGLQLDRGMRLSQMPRSHLS